MSDNPPVKTIFRAVAKNLDETTISHALLQHKNIKHKIRGFVSCLLSYDDDWELEVQYMIDNYPEGKNAVYKLIQDTMAAGFMGRFTVRNERGHIVKHCYWITDDPECVPLELEEGETLVKISGEHNQKYLLPENREVVRTKKEHETTSPVPENREIGPTSQKSGMPTSQKTGSGDFIRDNINNNNYYYNIIKSARAKGGVYALGAEAMEAYMAVQEKAGFQAVIDCTPPRLKSLGIAVEKCGGIGRWKDLLERATHSDFCKGKTERKFVMSIHGMSNLNVLEQVSKSPLLIGPSDKRWQAWFEWSLVNKPGQAKIMQDIAEGKSKLNAYPFKTAYPPIGGSS